MSRMSNVRRRQQERGLIEAKRTDVQCMRPDTKNSVLQLFFFTNHTSFIGLGCSSVTIIVIFIYLQLCVL